MTYDYLKKIRTVLLNDAIISAAVGANIRVQEQPESRVTKQITLRDEFGRSDSIITSTNPTLFITVWIKQKEVSEPYKTCRELVKRIIEILNRKGESLNESDLIINQIVKTDASVRYDESQEYWVGNIIFNIVINE